MKTFYLFLNDFDITSFFLTYFLERWTMTKSCFLGGILCIFFLVGFLVLYDFPKMSYYPEFKIELYGNRIMNIDEIFEEPGFYAYDGIDGDLTKQVIVEDLIDYRVKGTYEVKYSVKNSRGETFSITRFVILDKALI